MKCLTVEQISVLAWDICLKMLELCTFLMILWRSGKGTSWGFFSCIGLLDSILIILWLIYFGKCTVSLGDCARFSFKASFSLFQWKPTQTQEEHAPIKPVKFDELK